MPNFNKLAMGAFDDIPWEGSSTGASSSSTKYDRNVKRLKAGKSVQVRFACDPGRMAWEPSLSMLATDDGSWVKYREVQAWEDVQSKDHPDNRVSHVYIPVADIELTGSGSRVDRKDPVQRALRANDKELSDPKWGKPYPKAKDVMLVSVVFEGGSFGKEQYDPEPGDVILLALSPLQHQQLGDEFKTAIKYRSDFSLTDGVWTLLWDNPTPKNPSNWSLSLNVDTDVPPLDSRPEILDGREVLKAIRAATEQELFGLDEALAEAEAEADDDAVAAFEEAVAALDEAEDDVPEWDKPEAKQHLTKAAKPAAKPAAEGDNPFRRRSPAWVKGMLKKHKVEFDPRTPNDQLYDLALEHLPVEIAA